MIRSISLALLLAAMFASTAQAGATCTADASRSWAAGGEKLTVEGHASGPDCARAVVTLIIRDAKGQPIWTEADIGQNVMLFADGANMKAKEMAAALKEWIAGDNMTSSDKLPNWPQGADGPAAGAEGGDSFPFYPSSDLDRDGYLDIRKAKSPMLCIVTGMESTTCLVYKDGGVTAVGQQSFPG